MLFIEHGMCLSTWGVSCLCVVVPHRHAAMDPLVGDSVEVMEAKRAVQR